MTAALMRYRVMAVITGISLLLLVFVMMPIRYIGGNPRPSELFSPFHGLMYMLYVITVLDLFSRAALGLSGDGLGHAGRLRALCFFHC